MENKSVTIPFINLLNSQKINEDFDNDELVKIVLPLLEKVDFVHQQLKKSAPLEGIRDLKLNQDGALDIELNDAAEIIINQEVLKDVEEGRRVIANNVSESNSVVEITKEDQDLRRLKIQKNVADEIEKPVYLLNYISYEHKIQHHDIKTDVFSLGMILASLAFGLDFHKLRDLKTFVSKRDNLFILNLDLHPAIADLIYRMTDLDRRKRYPNLREVIEKVKDYDSSPASRVEDEIPEEKEEEVENFENIDERRRKALESLKQQVVQRAASSLLYNLANAKGGGLYFLRKTKEAKIIVSVDKGTRLFINKDDNLKKFIRGRNINLSKELNLLENENIGDEFFKINKKALQQKRDYGSHSLYVVLSRLKWMAEDNTSNSEEDLKETPFLLLPVKIQENNKKKDELIMSALSHEAEINPVLRQILNDKFGINLAKKINLEDNSLEDIFHKLKNYLLSRGSNLDIELLTEDVDLYDKKVLKGRGDDIATSPNRWIYDISDTYLGNFDIYEYYILDDFNYLLKNQLPRDNFDRIFLDYSVTDLGANLNKGAGKSVFNISPISQEQSEIIKSAKKGDPLLIDFPNGVQKYTLMANMIADASSVGKKILVISNSQFSAKRVKEKLMEKGLDKMVMHINDPYKSRKLYLRSVQEAYEEFLKATPNQMNFLRDIESLNKEIETEKGIIKSYIDCHKYRESPASETIYSLLERLTKLKESYLEIVRRNEQEIPSYQVWQRYSNEIRLLSKALREVGEDPRFANNSLRYATERLLVLDIPTQVINQSLKGLKKMFQNVLNVFSNIDIDSKYWSNFKNIKRIVSKAYSIRELAENDILFLLNKKHPKTISYSRIVNKYNRKKVELEEIFENNAGWHHKLSESELKNAMEKITGFDNTPFSFMSPAFRNFKKYIEEHYDFSRHADKPSLFQVLSSLKNEYDLVTKLGELTHTIQNKYGIKDIERVDEMINNLRIETKESLDEERDYLLNHPRSRDVILKLSSAQDDIIEIQNILRDIVVGYGDMSLVRVIEICRDIGFMVPKMKRLKVAFDRFVKLPNEVKKALRTIPMTEKEAEYLMAKKTVDDYLGGNEEILNITGEALIKKMERVKNIEKQVIDLNRQYILDFTKKKFKSKINLTLESYTQLDEKRKIFKKVYNTGRRILENEFNRSIRCKSIPELIERESGLVLNDLKPIWVVNSCYVSNMIPIDTLNFDLVIVDEVEALPLSSIIPALFRADQVVGITRKEIFKGKKDDTNENSLAKNLKRTLPTAEVSFLAANGCSSISNFRNNVFYENKLILRPCNRANLEKKSRIIIDKRDDFKIDVDRVVKSEISFHYLQNGYQEKNQNEVEARYIAKIIRDIYIFKKGGPSIGVVAMTEDQKYLIESSISELRRSDEEFNRMLEKQERSAGETEDKVFYVESFDNLKNIPRDLIIVSGTFGYNLDGEMNYDFGAVGEENGAKNLELLLSLVLKGMVLVSSIEYEDIENIYSPGIGHYKDFLQYAEAISSGNLLEAESVLIKSLVDQGIKVNEFDEPRYIIKQIGKQIESLGYRVDYNVGQGPLTIDIGVRDNTVADKYKLGILVDILDYEGLGEKDSSSFLRYDMLQDSEWQVHQVFVKDWHSDSEKVIEGIRDILGVEENLYGEEILSMEEDTQTIQESDSLEKLKIEFSEENSMNVKDKVVEPEIQVHKINFGQKTGKLRVES